MTATCTLLGILIDMTILAGFASRSLGLISYAI
jgi:hypothetical protein